MDTKYKSKICVISLLLLNTLQFSIPQLHSTSPQRKSFSEIYIGDSEIDDVKACQTVDKAAKFSQLIENRVQDLKTYYTPWQLSDQYKKQLNDQQKKYKDLIKKLIQEVITPENQRRLDSLKKNITNTNKQLEKCEIQIRNCTAELSNFPSPWEGFQDAFSKFKLDNVDSIKLEKITLSTDAENITCYVYSPQSDPGTTPSYPCIFWLHGGSVGTKDNCRYSNPNQLDISLDDFLSSIYNFTPGLQPLARYLVQNGVAFATITIRGKDGNGNIRQQIKDQIEKIKKLDYIDSTKMAFIGHSNGGHIMSQMIANEHAFLNDNFKLGVGLASPYINESWGTCLINVPIIFDSFNHFAFKHAAPNDVLETIDCSISIKKFRGQEAEYVYKYVNPFSITSGMSREELQTIFRQLTIPVFLFVGLEDQNTAPTTQNGTVAWLFKEIGFENWRTFAYAGAAHSPHRIQNVKTDENISDERLKAFKDMLSDILSIGKGTPNEGTQDLKIFNQDAIVKQYSPELIFLRFENDEKIQILFKDTDCGKEILRE
ncbi:MAG: hypothetical protein LBF34_04225 [Puniceicoccales bacterium]|jgi:predicted esterase|nr:hypothetical protein [Puniceicoccales bacterium]